MFRFPFRNGRGGSVDSRIRGTGPAGRPRRKPETESRDTSVAQRRRPTGDAKAARCMPRHDDRLCGKRFSLWRWSPLAEARADVTAGAVVPRDQGGAIPAGLGTVHPDPQESGSYAGGVVTPDRRWKLGGRFDSPDGTHVAPPLIGYCQALRPLFTMLTTASFSGIAA